MTSGGVIDFNHLEKYVAGDDALRDEILEIFADQVALLLDQFDVFQTDEAWKNTAHTLKGASRGVGAWKLGEICEDAENLIGPAPGKQESRATLLVSLRVMASDAMDEARRFRLAAAI
ncbi:Hpt domain-containing protein [Hyphococcus sp.]|jgi:HPt (histidine-containing phosphotransfer) domain-containing protein|uniref:Hpt domain-containing protein n=1 Tax=Hyphococcus sp. TaxID=2038636 RepID=UPI003D0C6A03